MFESGFLDGNKNIETIKKFPNIKQMQLVEIIVRSNVNLRKKY